MVPRVTMQCIASGNVHNNAISVVCSVLLHQSVAIYSKCSPSNLILSLDKAALMCQLAAKIALQPNKPLGKKLINANTGISLNFINFIFCGLKCFFSHAICRQMLYVKLMTIQSNSSSL